MKRSKHLVFGDATLPVNNLTPERIAEIEKLAMPLLDDMLEKLRQEQPDLFRSKSGNK